MDNESGALWQKIWEASNKVPHAEITLPESRTIERDWVRDGMHIPRYGPVQSSGASSNQKHLAQATRTLPIASTSLESASENHG